MNLKMWVRCFGWLALSLPLLALAEPESASEAPLDDPVAGAMQRLLATGEQPAGETLHALPLLRRLYAANRYRAFWSDGATASLMAELEGLQAHGLRSSDYLLPALRPYLAGPVAGQADAEAVALRDLLFSEACVRAIYHLYFGKVDAKRLDASINFSRDLQGDPLPRLLAALQSGRIDELFAWARPQNTWYLQLQAALARYRDIAQAGGWPRIDAGETLEAGDRDPRVAVLRQRLRISGDLEATPVPDPQSFDLALAQAVARFQQRHGLEMDGLVGRRTLAALNVPVEQRIEQIRVNLERMRWIMHQAYDDFILVDIAGFQVYWIRDQQVVWQEPAQVGNEYTQTPVFMSEIRYLEFNPYWTIPPGILRRTVLPALQNDPGYLEKKGYQLLTQQGEPLDPQEVDWNAIKTIPYMVRQPPGPDNALGLVKFMFPNPHLVFLHDTNHRELFDRNKRTFSSGCVRVRNPFDLAERLLARQPGWDRQRIDRLVATGRNTRVDLQQPMRILIAYNTAHVLDGRIYFKADIYRRDARVLAALDGPFQIHAKAARLSQK